MTVKSKIQSLINHCNRKTAGVTTDLTNAVKALSARLDRYADGAAIQVEYMDIAPYRSGDTFTAPTKEGYYFAGWFTDEVCASASKLAETTLTGNAYAKFVPASVLDVHVSVDSAIPNSEGKYAVRALSTVVDMALSSIGFIYGLPGGEEKKWSATTVYKTITWHDKKPYEDFCSLSIYYFAFTIPGANLDSGCVIKPFWKTLDGTTVRGKSVSVVVKDLVQDKCVARIGETYYATLELAMSAAADGDVIDLLADCKHEGKIVVDKSITFRAIGEARSITIVPADTDA